jgi:hypothetical protein
MSIEEYANALPLFSEAKRLVNEAIAGGETSPAIAEWVTMLDERIAECEAAMK